MTSHRWQRMVLRAQGRLDGENADRLLPWVFAAGLFAVLTALDAAALRGFEGGSGAGAWLQAAWRRQHGGTGFPVGGADPATGAWSLIAEPVLWVSRFLPPEAVFSVVQAGAIGVGIVPLWKLGRDHAHLRVGAATVAVATYALAPTRHRSNLSPFHPEVIALPVLLWAYLHGLQGHVKRYSVLVLVVLACRADLGVTVVAMGLLLASTGRRRIGLASAAGGLAWSVAAVIALHPEVPDQALTPSGEFVARTVTPLAVFAELFAHPLRELGGLLAESSVTFLVVVFSPLLFLPLVSPRRLAAAVPCLGLAMMSDRGVQRSAQAGVIDLAPAAAHIAPAMAFVFIALIFALERIGTLGVTRVNVDRRVLAVLLAGAALLFVAAAPSSPYRRPWSWGSQDAVDGARLQAAALVDPSEAVAVSPGSTVVVAERAELVELPPQPSDLAPRRIGRIARRVDAVLLDTTGTDPRTGEAFWPIDERQRVLRVFRGRGFAVAYRSHGIYLLRSAPR
ncbi:MAG: DUF2079 domain-containing protein [Acidimicrobiales bacterium]